MRVESDVVGVRHRGRARSIGTCLCIRNEAGLVVRPWLGLELRWFCCLQQGIPFPRLTFFQLQQNSTSRTHPWLGLRVGVRIRLRLSMGLRVWVRAQVKVRPGRRSNIGARKGGPQDSNNSTPHPLGCATLPSGPSPSLCHHF